MSAKKTTKNKVHIDKALGEMIDAANPALKKITGNRYRIQTDPAMVIKYCIKNWGQVRSDLEPHGITLRKLKSARERNTEATATHEKRTATRKTKKEQPGNGTGNHLDRSPIGSHADHRRDRVGDPRIPTNLWRTEHTSRRCPSSNRYAYKKELGRSRNRNPRCPERIQTPTRAPSVTPIPAQPLCLTSR